MSKSVAAVLAGALMVGSASTAFAQATGGANTTTGTTTGTVGSPSTLRERVDPPTSPTGEIEVPDSTTGATAAPDSDPTGQATQTAPRLDRDTVGTTPSISTSTDGLPPDTSTSTVVPGAEAEPAVPDASAGAAITTGSVMNEDELHDELEARGIADIRNLEGPFFTATAEVDGEEVELRVDARTGAIVAPERLATRD